MRDGVLDGERQGMSDAVGRNRGGIRSTLEADAASQLQLRSPQRGLLLQQHHLGLREPERELQRIGLHRGAGRDASPRDSELVLSALLLICRDA